MLEDDALTLVLRDLPGADALHAAAAPRAFDRRAIEEFGLLASCSCAARARAFELRAIAGRM